MKSILNLVKGLVAISMVLLSAGCATPSGDYSQANAGIGIVVLHGKANYPAGHNSYLVRTLRSEGFRVVEPSMPWKGARGVANYSAGIDAAFNIIEKEIHRLHIAGAEKVFVVGHSMGAMAAFSFSAHRGGIVGVVGIAPGHSVGGQFHRGVVGESVDKARALVAAGKGNQRAWFQDYNGALRPIVNTTPEIYLSYFDPDGKANMLASLSQLKSIPLLWIAPSDDPVTVQGFAKSAFASAPANEASKLVTITGGHADAPSKSGKLVSDWVTAIAGRR